jgi:hypothetical protein
MALTRLQDDLLQEFREEKRLITGQIEIFNPLAMSLRKPAAQRLAASGALIFGEVLCWLAAPACIAAAVFLKKLYPFYKMFEVRHVAAPQPIGTISGNTMEPLQWAVYIMFGLLAVLFIVVANMLGRIRRKNAVLNLAGKHIKTLVGQHLNRKAAIDAIEQRHFLEMPVANPVPHGVNEVPNPAYEGEGVERVEKV